MQCLMRGCRAVGLQASSQWGLINSLGNDPWICYIPHCLISMRVSGTVEGHIRCSMLRIDVCAGEWRRRRGPRSPLRRAPCRPSLALLGHTPCAPAHPVKGEDGCRSASKSIYDGLRCLYAAGTAAGREPCSKRMHARWPLVIFTASARPMPLAAPVMRAAGRCILLTQPDAPVALQGVEAEVVPRSSTPCSVELELRTQPFKLVHSSIILSALQLKQL
jgi:hypothetical protein